MTGKPRKPIERQPDETAEPKQQMQDDGSADGGVSFANIEPDGAQSFANIDPANGD